MSADILTALGFQGYSMSPVGLVSLWVFACFPQGPEEARGIRMRGALELRGSLTGAVTSCSGHKQMIGALLPIMESNKDKRVVHLLLKVSLESLCGFDF